MQLGKVHTKYKIAKIITLAPVVQQLKLRSVCYLAYLVPTTTAMHTLPSIQFQLVGCLMAPIVNASVM